MGFKNTVACATALIMCGLYAVSPQTTNIQQCVSADETFSTYDLLNVKKHILGNDYLEEEDFFKLDANQDGVITTADLMIIKRTILGSIQLPSYGGNDTQTPSNDVVRVTTVLDTATLSSKDVVYCYDCSNSLASTEVMYTFKLTDNDKQILQNFMDQHFTSDMNNSEKIEYTMNWLHQNINYTLSQDYASLPSSFAECGFVQQAGQCLQYNGALAYMLAYMGYDTNLIFLKNGSWQHFTCQVRIDGQTYRMEVGNKGLEDGSHYMGLDFLSLE